MKSRDPRRLKFARQSFKPRQTARIVLANGTPAHLLPDRQLPVVSFGGMFRTGNIYEPPDKTGLASMTAGVMRLGGSKRYPGDELDEKLDYMGARIEIGTDDDSFWFEVWCLKRNLSQVMAILADVIWNPAFPREKTELVRAREMEAIQRRFDQPAAVADLMFRQTVYGKDTVWGKLNNATAIKGLSRRDLSAFHEKQILSGPVVLSAAGDFKEKEMAALLQGAFGGRPRAVLEMPALTPVRVGFPGGIFLVPREVGQASFRIGHLGIKLDNPDYFALRLMDMILGNGAFSTRLFRDIRTERGLAYAIWSRLAPRILDVGTFHVGGETKYESLGEATGAILGHLNDLQKRQATKKELLLAKNTLENGFAFEFQSAMDIAWRQAEYEYSNLPKDWLFIEREKILAATARDVQRVARAHLHPEGAIILAVGDPKRCRPALERFGPVKLLPLPS